MFRWVVIVHPDFTEDFFQLPEGVLRRFAVVSGLLEDNGPALGRPNVDTLRGSSYPNMKEIRFQIGNAYWRFAFAFDKERRAVVLVGGNKGGENQTRFYDWLIRVADQRYAQWLAAEEED